MPAWDGNPAHAPGSPPSVLDEFDPGDASGLDARRLMKWDFAKQSLLDLDRYDPSEFGSLLLGSGYWIKLNTGDPIRVSFSGVSDSDSTDMWISLPRVGWTLIGYPYSYPAPDATPGPPYYTGTAYPWSSVKVTDGMTTKSLSEASQYSAGWIRSVAFWYDTGSGGFVSLGLPDDRPVEGSLIAWHGYWVKSLKDDLALIFEANPPSP